MDDKNSGKQRKRGLASIKNYQIVFGSEAGQKVLWDLMKYSGMLQSPIELNPNEVLFKEGKQDMVRHILNKTKVDIKKLEDKITKGLKNERDGWDVYDS